MARLSAALALAGACACEPMSSSEPEAAAPAAKSGEVARPSGALPPAGELTVSVADGKVTLLANGVARERALEGLGKAVGFGTRVVPGLEEGKTVTLDLREQPPERAVEQILAGVPYLLRYEVDEASGAHRLSQVVAGVRSALAAGGAAQDPAERREAVVKRMRERMAERRARVAEMSPEEREKVRAEQRARMQETQATRERDAEDVQRALESRDPAVRREAVEELDADEPPEIARLGQLALEDPDAGVRAAAAEQLGDGQGWAAVQSLLAVLQDRDPTVVVAALEALEWVGDESLLPQLQPLLRHSDPAVREAAQETIEFLE